MSDKPKQTIGTRRSSGKPKSGIPAGGYVVAPAQGYVYKPSRGKGVEPPLRANRSEPERAEALIDHAQRRAVRSQQMEDVLHGIAMNKREFAATRVTAAARLHAIIEGQPMQMQKVEHSGHVDMTPEEAEDRIAEIMKRAAERAGGLQ